MKRILNNNCHFISKINPNIFVRLSSSIRSKSIDDIPGPINLPFIGSSWQFLPIIGPHDLLHLHLMALSHYKKYGEIVYERMGSTNIVHLFNPKHFEIVSNATFDYPIRNSFYAMKRYRETNKELYNNAGIFVLNNEEWWQLRKKFQKSVSSVKEVVKSLKFTDEITKEFLNSLKPGETVKDFMAISSRLSLELASKLMFDVRLNCFGKNPYQDDFYIRSLIEAITDIAVNTSEYDTKEMSFFKYFRNKNFKKMKETFSLIEEFIIKMINTVKEREDVRESQCLIAQYLRNTDIVEKDITGIALDLLLGSIDTTSGTTSFLLYEVARSPEVQNKLIQEAVTLLPTPNTIITKEILNQAVYTRATLKETLRLYPINWTHTRRLDQDILIDDYRIPTNTMICLQILTASLMECHFKNAKRFHPERWVKIAVNYEYINPNLATPFGLGRRRCLAQRRAEQQICILLLNIFCQYRIKWMKEDKLEYITPFLARPQGPVPFMLERH